MVVAVANVDDVCSEPHAFCDARSLCVVAQAIRDLRHVGPDGQVETGKRGLKVEFNLAMIWIPDTAT